jgi:outer membrane protein assembly factor BamB
MIRLQLFFLSFLLLLLNIGCTKTDVIDDTPDNPQPTPPNGTLYINGVGEFLKIDMKDSAVLWTSQTRNLAASFNNPMTFDSTSFYHGNTAGLTAYSTQTGIPRWSFSWIVINNNTIPYREPAFKDSLLFLTSPSNLWDRSYLHCLNKKTGVMYWKKQLDLGDVNIPFNTTPMIMNDKVIMLTRDANNRKRLTALNVADGAPMWNSGVNDSLSFHLTLKDGNIYSTSKQYIVCYNATDGSLKWQTDLNYSTFNATATFFEPGKLIIVKVLNTEYKLFTINIADGSIIKQSSLSVPTQVQNTTTAPLGCNYVNNTLFVASRHNSDSASIKAYDFSNSALKWEKRFANYFYTEFTPLLSDEYLIFPINNTYPNGKSVMYFLDFNGKVATGIPFNANYTAGFIYAKNGIIYKQNNTYVGR